MNSANIVFSKEAKESMNKLGIEEYRVVAWVQNMDFSEDTLSFIAIRGREPDGVVYSVSGSRINEESKEFLVEAIKLGSEKDKEMIHTLNRDKSIMLGDILYTETSLATMSSVDWTYKDAKILLLEMLNADQVYQVTTGIVSSISVKYANIIIKLEKCTRGVVAEITVL